VRRLLSCQVRFSTPRRIVLTTIEFRFVQRSRIHKLRRCHRFDVGTLRVRGQRSCKIWCGACVVEDALLVLSCQYWSPFLANENFYRGAGGPRPSRRRNRSQISIYYQNPKRIRRSDGAILFKHEPKGTTKSQHWGRKYLQNHQCFSLCCVALQYIILYIPFHAIQTITVSIVSHSWFIAASGLCRLLGYVAVDIAYGSPRCSIFCELVG